MINGSLEARYNLMRGKLGKPWQPPRHQVHRWMTDLTRAVCFLHQCSNPIMHRDLKLSNLLLSAHDHLKVSDFGLCNTLKKVREGVNAWCKHSMSQVAALIGVDSLEQ